MRENTFVIGAALLVMGGSLLMEQWNRATVDPRKTPRSCGYGCPLFPGLILPPGSAIKMRANEAAFAPQNVPLLTDVTTREEKVKRMNTNTWIWIALIAFLVFCCGPMLFMGRRHSKDSDRTNMSDETKNKASSEKQPERKDLQD